MLSKQIYQLIVRMHVAVSAAPYVFLGYCAFVGFESQRNFGLVQLQFLPRISDLQLLNAWRFEFQAFRILAACGIVCFVLLLWRFGRRDASAWLPALVFLTGIGLLLYALYANPLGVLTTPD